MLELPIHPKLIQKILGILLMVFSLTVVPPIITSIVFNDIELTAFIISLLVTFLSGFALWHPVQSVDKELNRRDGFVIVVALWIVLGIFAALPFLLLKNPQLSFFQAFFEALSALTTTGSTVIVGLDHLPPSLLFYRQELQWLGGMGIIVLAIAILPFLQVGGMQLFRAEIPGPVKDAKLTPRITETAKLLWYIYLGLTIACSIAYYLAGMSWFDAISHSFATVSTGGFSTHDASLGYFQSSTINWIAIVFMFLAGINFNLHFLVLAKKNLKHYFKDEEFYTYLFLLIFFSTIIIFYLAWQANFKDFSSTVNHSVLQVVSVMTSTGFTTVDFSLWPSFLPVLLLLSSFIGGCSGSTAGGLKVIRFILLYKQLMRELTYLVHPHAQASIKIGAHSVSNPVINAVWGFFAAYVIIFALLFILVMASGLDQVSALSAVAACINNLGPGLEQVATNFSQVNDFGLFCLTIAMLLGRLEIFTILILFTPLFWKK